MGVEGCTKCIKYLLFFCNFIFWLAGGVILGVALWLRNDGKISSLLGLELDGTQAPNSFYVCVHILIAVGAVMMVVGFLGCYGAIQESQCLLGTVSVTLSQLSTRDGNVYASLTWMLYVSPQFFVCLVILFACEVAAGVWGYMHKDTVSQEMKNFYDSVYDQAMVKTLEQDKKTAVAKVLKVFHETLNCCGKGQVTSILTQLTSDICPEKWTTVNCHSKIDTLFTDNIHLIEIAALVVAIIMIFEMIFSMVLCCGIRNSPVY
ncbi:CD81 protein isoform X1 [Nothobranchius furzeri]|uniref:CD81 protein isoform X1 n=1 Tax=Nothobranchius furzeri TaxID=105023 RepID=UPI003904CFE9